MQTHKDLICSLVSISKLHLHLFVVGMTKYDEEHCMVDEHSMVVSWCWRCGVRQYGCVVVPDMINIQMKTLLYVYLKFDNYKKGRVITYKEKY